MNLSGENDQLDYKLNDDKENNNENKNRKPERIISLGSFSRHFLYMAGSALSKLVSVLTMGKKMEMLLYSLFHQFYLIMFLYKIYWLI